MTKIVSLILLCSLLLVCFAGCSAPENKDDPPGNSSTELQSDDDLVLALTSYLRHLHIDHDMPATSTEIKMDEIKRGRQALHVEFDPSSPYFVCAYYREAHEYEAILYCCAAEYTWVKFENANEITDQYKDSQFIVAFQVNKAAFVTDIMNESASVPDMEHFQQYVPAFDNGNNTDLPLVFDKTYIYLNASDKCTVYHSTAAYDNRWVTLPCIYLDEQYYVVVELDAIHPNGDRLNINTAVNFGKYYDALLSIMITDKYSVTDKKGGTIIYGLFEIDDFVNCINE